MHSLSLHNASTDFGYTEAVKALSLAAYLAFLIERLSQAIQARPRPVPAQIRQLEGVRRELRLELAYHPAQSRNGYVFIPKDQYFRESERVLETASASFE